MSNSFEKEYKQQINEQLPDLWDRIESRLPEKSTTPETIQRRTTTKRKSKQKQTITMIVTLAASIMIALIAVPIVLFNGAKSKSAEMYSDSEYDMAETAEATEAEVTEAMESEPEMAVSNASDQALGSEGIGEKTMKEEAVEETSATQETPLSDEVKASGVASEKRMAEPNVVLYENITIKVGRIENTGEEVIYYGVVITDPANHFAPGYEIPLCIFNDEFPVMIEGKNYVVTFEEQEYGPMIIDSLVYQE